jgi:hypothetical protein
MDYDRIPKEVISNLRICAASFNKELNNKRWSADYFKESLARLHPTLVTNQCAWKDSFCYCLVLTFIKEKTVVWTLNIR